MFGANKIKDLFSGKQSDLISKGTRTSLLDSILNNNKKSRHNFNRLLQVLALTMIDHL